MIQNLLQKFIDKGFKNVYTQDVWTAGDKKMWQFRVGSAITKTLYTNEAYWYLVGLLDGLFLTK